MATQPHSTTTPNTQSADFVNSDPERFTVNGCTSLIAESHDYYRQAHALCALAEMAFAEAGDDLSPNSQIMASALEGIGQLLSHGIYQQDQEGRQRAKRSRESRNLIERNG